jgi:hypothetical protein
MSQSQFEEHSTVPNREFKNSLVDSSWANAHYENVLLRIDIYYSPVPSGFTARDKGESYQENHPYDDDSGWSSSHRWSLPYVTPALATQEGGYGGDPFTRRNQTNYDRGQFGGIATPAEPADPQDYNAGDEEFDRREFWTLCVISPLNLGHLCSGRRFGNAGFLVWYRRRGRAQEQASRDGSWQHWRIRAVGQHKCD